MAQDGSDPLVPGEGGCLEAEPVPDGLRVGEHRDGQGEVDPEAPAEHVGMGMGPVVLLLAHARGDTPARPRQTLGGLAPGRIGKECRPTHEKA